MNNEKHRGHFEAPREKKRLTGRQKGALGIVLALAVLIGLGVGIYKTVVRPPQKTEPVVETQPEAEETKEPEIKLPTIKHVVTKVDEDTGEEIEEELDTEIAVHDKIGTIEYDYPAFHLSMDCFWCEVVSGELVLKEAEAARWLTKKELDSVPWLPADQLLLAQIRPAL